jgi:hypothetical protein
LRSIRQSVKSNHPQKFIEEHFMRRILIVTMTAIFLLLVFTACSSQDEAALPTRAALAELEEPAIQPENGETAVQPTESVPSAAEQETLPGEQKPLPSLATAPTESSYEIGLGGTSLVADGEESTQAALFSNATFSLDTTLPTGITEAQVWQQPAVPLDVERANTIAQRWGFTGPLYTFAIPDESVIEESGGEGYAQLPTDYLEFHAFDGAKSIIITEASAYFTDDSVPFDYEIPRPFEQHAPAVEAVLQSMGLLDFPYTLADGWGHEVWVNRVLDGMATDYPEIGAGVSENGRLAFASYQPLDHLTATGTYPLISAETAWQQIQDGINEDILFTITENAETSEVSWDSPSNFQYWPRTQRTGQEVHLYGMPTVFLPVDEGSPPLIQALNYTVRTDETTNRALAEQAGTNVHFWGMLDAATKSLALTGWEPLPDLNPLIKNGAIQRQNEQTVLVDPEGSLFILPDAPADLADGSFVNVFAWAAREAGLAYPVLDWEGIDMQIGDGSGETMAFPEIEPFAPPVYKQISVNNVELAYYVYPEFQQTENGRYQQSYLLLPVWQFTATADNGDTLQFTVQATE